MSDMYGKWFVSKIERELKSVKTKSANKLKQKDEIIERLEGELKECTAILKDFRNTNECKQTWVEEMHATIDDVLKKYE